MKLIQVLCLVLTELSIGSLLMVCLLPSREIRTSFFTFNSLLCALTAAIAVMLSKAVLQSAWMDVRFLGLTVIGATAAYGAFRLEKPHLGRLLLLASGLTGFAFGLMPLMQHSLAARRVETTVPWFFDAGVLSATLLLGATNVAMILGHWYLLMRRLSFEHLVRFAQIVLGAVALRAVVVFATISSQPTKPPPACCTSWRSASCSVNCSPRTCSSDANLRQCGTLAPPTAHVLESTR